jgi:hypothetical protein
METMPAFEDLKPGSRLRGLDPAGIAEVVQVARFGPDALNLVFRVDGRVGERLVYRGEETGFRRGSPRSANRALRNSSFLLRSSATAIAQVPASMFRSTQRRVSGFSARYFSTA